MNDSYEQLSLFDLNPYCTSSQSKPQKRTASIKVYLTPEEKAQFEENAAREGITLSEKIRKTIQPSIKGN